MSDDKQMDKISSENITKLRLMLLGNLGVGKTSIITQFINNSFREAYFPTNDIIIYKKLYNFSPENDKIDEFVFVEILDTVGYNKFKELHTWSDFFNDIIVKDYDISSENKKINLDKIKIKHEYKYTDKNNYEKNIDDREKRNNFEKLGLFSNDRVMCYLFVFEYDEDEKYSSFNDILGLAKLIQLNEKQNEDNMIEKSLKFFIANKFPFFVEKTSKFYNKLETPYEKYIKDNLKNNYFNTEINKNTDDHLFFVNAKYKYGINSTFDTILNKLYETEKLWKKIITDDRQDGQDEIHKKILDDSLWNKICCGKRYKDEEKNNDNKEIKDVKKVKVIKQNNVIDKIQKFERPSDNLNQETKGEENKTEDNKIEENKTETNKKNCLLI